MPDWSALHRFVAERSRLPFAGEQEWDCCVCFAAGGVAALTGRDPLARFTSTWSTRRGVVRVLRRHGGLEAAVSEVLEPIAPGLARRGDLALVPAEGLAGAGLVIVEGDHLVGPSADGVRRLPRTAMTAAWRSA